MGIVLIEKNGIEKEIDSDGFNWDLILRGPIWMQSRLGLSNSIIFKDTLKTLVLFFATLGIYGIVHLFTFNKKCFKLMLSDGWKVVQPNKQSYDSFDSQHNDNRESNETELFEMSNLITED